MTASTPVRAEQQTATHQGILAGQCMPQSSATPVALQERQTLRSSLTLLESAATTGPAGQHTIDPQLQPEKGGSSEPQQQRIGQDSNSSAKAAASGLEWVSSVPEAKGDVAGFSGRVVQEANWRGVPSRAVLQQLHEAGRLTHLCSLHV